jgi:hypothetical protein
VRQAWSSRKCARERRSIYCNGACAPGSGEKCLPHVDETYCEHFLQDMRLMYFQGWCRPATSSVQPGSVTVPGHRRTRGIRQPRGKKSVMEPHDNKRETVTGERAPSTRDDPQPGQAILSQARGNPHGRASGPNPSVEIHGGSQKRRRDGLLPGLSAGCRKRTALIAGTGAKRPGEGLLVRPGNWLCWLSGSTIERGIIIIVEKWGAVGKKMSSHVVG